MTKAFEKIRAGLSEALEVARGNPAVIQHIKVTPSCGCVFCDLDLKPERLRRRWVHHIPAEGRLVPCDFRNLKPGS
jgi:hypothetical protein